MKQRIGGPEGDLVGSGPRGTENAELRAAMREYLRGYADLLTVARCLLAQVEQRIPLPADSIKLHREKFDNVEEQVRQLDGMLDALAAPVSGRLPLILVTRASSAMRRVPLDPSKIDFTFLGGGDS